MSSKVVVVLVLGSTMLSGCFLWTTRGEGDRLEAEGRDREQRLRALESGMREEREQLRAEVQRAKQKVAELEQVLERATAVVTRNSADLGAEVQTIREQLAQLEGQIAELANASEQTRRELSEQRTALDARIEAFARRAGVDMPVDQAAVPQDRAEHWSAAGRAHAANEHSQARALLREYIRRYPQDDKVDDALYMIGTSYVREGRPASALGEFRRVIAEHGQGDMVDDTLLAMAEAFYRLHACTDARGALDALIRAHPRSPLIREARAMLREVQRAPRGYCTS